MANFRLLVAQGKQIVFSVDKPFSEVWEDVVKESFVELEGELVDGDDRHMGHAAIQREHIIALFMEAEHRRDA